MPETDLNTRERPHYLLVLIYVLVLVGLGFVLVGVILGAFLALIPFDGDFVQLSAALSDPASHPEVKHAMYIVQGTATLVGLVLVPAVILRGYGLSVPALFRGRRLEALPVLATVFAVFAFMGLNSVFIEWNAGLDLPAFMEGLERWMRTREDSAAELTETLTRFDAGWELVAVIFVVAVLPAFGEEIVFRGMVQNVLFRGTANIHVAIWISAAIFSAVHLQFFGFIPRLLLGALFGYLYYWSGSLLLVVIAHFANNAISVLALYFYQNGTMDVNLETPEAAPLPFVIASTVVTAGLLYYLARYFQGHKRSFPQL